MKRFEIFFGVIKVPVDFIMTILAFLTAYELRLLTNPIEGLAKPIDYTALPSIDEFLKFSIPATLALIVIFAIGKMYTFRTTAHLSREIRKGMLLCIVWAMFIITYFFFTRTFPFSRLAMIYSWSLTFIFIVLGRSLVKLIQIIFLNLGIGKRNLVFIGNNNLTLELARELKNELSYNLLGIVEENQQKIPYDKSDLKILGNTNEFGEIIKRLKIDEVIQTSSNLPEMENETILEMCDLNHIAYRFVPDVIEVRRTNIEVSRIGTAPIISLKPTPLDGWGKVMKRIADIIGSIIGIIVFSPFMLITAIAIKLESKGPIFFTKLDDGRAVRRVGQFGQPIRFYKFRSMYPKTDHLRYTHLADKNIRTDGPLVKIKDDPRITKVGKFIRKYSIDELPQLFNVLGGSLSLVGPRPHLPEEVANYKKHHKFVLTIKPGITGISQTSGRSDLTFEDEMKLDRFYIENWSLLLDIKIILKTFLVVLKGYKE